MYRLLLTTDAAFWMLFGSLLAVGFRGHVHAAEPADAAGAAAVAAIEKLGGKARQIAVDSDELEIEFFLGGQQLMDEGLVHVAGLKNVVSLNLKATKITGAGLVHLKDLTKLRQLHLEKTAVGDEGIEHLKGLADLEYLNLYATNVTDKSLEHLSGLTNLKQLYVWQTNVTDEGVAKLAAALPKLRIVKGVDLSKLPPPPERKPPNPLKWIVAGEAKPPTSRSGTNTSVTFENKKDSRVKLYWISYGGQLKLYGELDPGAIRRQNTYSENTWVITDEKDKPLGHFIAVVDEGVAVIPK